MLVGSFFPNQGWTHAPRSKSAESPTTGPPRNSCLLKKKSIYVFKHSVLIFGCVGSLLLHSGFLQLRCAGFSLRWPLRLRSTGSVIVTQGLSSPEPCGIFRDQGSNPDHAPELAGGFLTTGPQGKSRIPVFFLFFKVVSSLLS